RERVCGVAIATFDGLLDAFSGQECIARCSEGRHHAIAGVLGDRAVRSGDAVADKPIVIGAQVVIRVFADSDPQSGRGDKVGNHKRDERGGHVVDPTALSMGADTSTIGSRTTVPLIRPPKAATRSTTWVVAGGCDSSTIRSVPFSWIRAALSFTAAR